MDYEESIAWIRRRANRERSIARHEFRVKADRLRRDLGIPTRQEETFALVQQGFKDMGTAAARAAEIFTQYGAHIEASRPISKFVSPERQPV